MKSVGSARAAWRFVAPQVVAYGPGAHIVWYKQLRPLRPYAARYLRQHAQRRQK